MSKASTDWWDSPSPDTLSVEQDFREIERRLGVGEHDFTQERRDQFKYEGAYRNWLNKAIAHQETELDNRDSYSSEPDPNAHMSRDEQIKRANMEDWEQYPGHKEDNLF